MRIHLLVIEVVVSLQVGAQGRVVLVGRQHEWRTAPPAPHELRRDQFLFFGRLAMLAQEVAKPAHMLLQTAIGHVAAVAGQNLGLRQVGGRSALRRGSRE